jgi:hypothetical protein
MKGGNSVQEEDLGYKYIQTTLSTSQHKEVKNFMETNGIDNQREWLREIIMKEVRRDNDSESLPLYQ